MTPARTVAPVLRDWPEPARQPNNTDCLYYATAYMAGIFGHAVAPNTIKQWHESTRYAVPKYLIDVLKISSSWHWWSNGGWVEHYISYTNAAPFKEWVQAYLHYGCVAIADIPICGDCLHAVVLLEGDDDGVLLADSIRGLVQEPWSLFASPSRHGQQGRIEAWFKLEQH